MSYTPFLLLLDNYGNMRAYEKKFHLIKLGHFDAMIKGCKEMSNHNHLLQKRHIHIEHVQNIYPHYHYNSTMLHLTILS